MINNKREKTINKRILITGERGFVENVLLQTFLNRGYKVRILDKLI